MKKLLLCLSILALSCNAFAGFIGSGRGTKESPYIITNTSEFNQIRSISTTPEMYFELANDIDMTAWLEDNNPTFGFNPIPSFSGNFDGKGHFIKFFINRPTSDNVGLFDSISNCHISNLRLEVEIKGDSYVGGLAGTLSNAAKNEALISNCSVKGNIIGKGSCIGGIFGKIDRPDSYQCKIEHCKSECTIEGASYVGGITGSNNGSISKCQSYCNINATGDYVGGITGSCASFTYWEVSSTSGSSWQSSATGSVCYCESNGSLIGKEYIGGIIGYCCAANVYGNLSNVEITGDKTVGGIIGQSERGGTINYPLTAYIQQNACVCPAITATVSDAYRIGKISGSGQIGAIGSSSENKALNTTVVTIAGEIQTVEGDNEQDGSNNGTRMMKRSSSYSSIGWNMQDIWGIDEGNGYPYLLGFTIAEPAYSDNEYDDYEAPTIAYANGKVTFASTLPNPTYFYKIVYADAEYNEATEVTSTPTTLKLYVYATSGADRTPTGCYDLIIDGNDINKDGIISIEDVTCLVNVILEKENKE